MASPSVGAPALKYGDVNTETTSPGEVKGLIKISLKFLIFKGIAMAEYIKYKYKEIYYKMENIKFR